MKTIRKTIIVLITAIMLLAGLFVPAETAQAKKSGPGYTSPPLCCDATQCKGGPGGKALLPKGITRVGPVTQPGLKR